MGIVGRKKGSTGLQKDVYAECQAQPTVRLAHAPTHLPPHSNLTHIQTNPNPSPVSSVLPSTQSHRNKPNTYLVGAPAPVNVFSPPIVADGPHGEYLDSASWASNGGGVTNRGVSSSLSSPGSESSHPTDGEKGGPVFRTGGVCSEYEREARGSRAGP
ncbi:hypothetical protein Salat_2656600 [Sesamum alatum]|uniref:Uncharacterized protein n=1 Tax=Sesamum alatum TaxID=300844 RepID=A0AAE1XP47_9LAMI|nr:hypothetical protein Salat_2656600 [Sesamum alatum]